VSGTVEISLNGRTVRADKGSTVAATLLSLGESAFRISESGEPRAPLCGMGTCYECRVTIDGVEQQRACLVRVRPGMRVVAGVDYR
jgi:predicted molibdopterin-dependent oxidoreductase YjgC